MKFDAESRRSGDSCLSDLLLDRLIAGEIGRDAHLDGCAGCAGRLELLVSEREEFSRRFWIQGLAMKTLERARDAERPRAARRSSFARVSAAVAMAAMLCIGIFVRPTGTDTRSKGGPTLSLWVRHLVDGRVERVLPGDTLFRGDQIRFEVGSDRAGTVTMVGVDRSGPTVYLVTGIAAGPARVLDGAIELDESTGSERFFALVCERGGVPDGRAAAIESPARRALQRAGGDPAGVFELGSGCRETSFLIQKGPPR